jgi:hypothetical protein
VREYHGAECQHNREHAIDELGNSESQARKYGVGTPKKKMQANETRPKQQHDDGDVDGVVSVVIRPLAYGDDGRAQKAIENSR